MPKTVLGDEGKTGGAPAPADGNPPPERGVAKPAGPERVASDDAPGAEADVAAEAEGAAQAPAAAAPADQAPGPPWGALRVAIIDDAMHPPRLDRLDDGEHGALSALVTTDAEVLADLAALGCAGDASVDDRLRALAESEEVLASFALIADVSPDALRMIDEHRSFQSLHRILTEEVQDVLVCDPYAELPDLTAHNLVLLDYYLKGPAHGGDLAVEVATQIRSQAGREPDQQIVLMSSLETVRELRGQFRAKSDVAGSAFAFIGKADLNESWKVKAHLGMLERARPYAPAFTDYRAKLDESLAQARVDLLSLVDDLDIGDYAFLQGRALMKDGHPLGDYVFWLLSSQLMAFAFERDEMRERQRALDRLEFVGAPFAATEPSTVVANLLHSALVSRNMGPLDRHPRAKEGTQYAQFPLVQLGDVFLDANRTKAVVVMSADCDLAFSPTSEREPDAGTPVMLVPGTPVKLREAKEDADPNTEGLLHREEVYRIVWEFSKYRSVELGSLRAWLEGQGFDVTNRDRLRPLFALKLQQEFGAHLMRVGPPVLPPTTTKAVGRIFICTPEQEEVAAFDQNELMVTRFKKLTWLRVTPRVAGRLKQECEELRSRLEALREAAAGKKKIEFDRKLESVVAALDKDDFWIALLDGVELNGPGSVKTVGPLGFVVGDGWTENKPKVVLEIHEGGPAAPGGAGAKEAQGDEVEVDVEIEPESVSAAD